MNRTALTLGATTVIGVIVSAHLWQELSAANAQVRDLQGRLTAVSAGQPVQLQPTPVVMDRSNPGSAPASRIATADAQAHAGQSASEDNATGKSVFSGSMEMLGDPAVRQSMASSIRASLPQKYPYLGEELNLTPEQLGKLYDQLTENQLAMLETTPRANADPDRRLMVGREHEARLAAVLGPTAYAQWKEYNATLDLRQQIGRLHTTLETSAQPLSDDQRRQLTTALVAYHKQLKQEDAQPARPAVAMSDADKTALVLERMRVTREGNQKLRDMARSYLTPEQLDAFSRVQNQESDFTLAMLRTQPGQQQR